MLSKEIIFLWFRRDFRLKENPAFAAAFGFEIFPLYIHSKNLEYPLGELSKGWLGQALVQLNEKLLGNLKIFHGDPIDIFKKLFEKFGVNKITCNKLYEPWEELYEEKLKEFCKEAGADFEIFDNYLLTDPRCIRREDGGIYNVFTPFYKKILSNLEKKSINENKSPNFVKLSSKLDFELPIDFLCSKNSKINSVLSNWRIDQEGAEKVFENFLEKISEYEEKRDFLSEDATSKLSAYLHFGHLSVWQIFNKINGIKNSEPFLRQLAWREFSYYNMVHNKFIYKRCLQENFESFPWEKDFDKLEKWQKGETGYNIIDAAMQELLTTGYMHNRARMIVASFLVKNLNIDWRLGQDFFWQNLCDADLANNSFGWQWVAGCGRDAAPFFRIFNPTLQEEKFDPKGLYVKKFFKKSLETKKIVEISTSRQQCLSRYKNWKTFQKSF